MGLIEDAMSAINDWFKGILADGIIGSLNNTNNIISDSLNGNGGSGMNPLFSQFLGSPESFTGSSGGGTPIWNIIHTLSDNIIVPLGGLVLAIVLVYELYSMVVNGNNFRDFDTSIFVRWILKAFIGVILIGNVFEIVTAVFSFGTGAVSDGIALLFPNGSQFVDSNVLATGTLRQSLVNNNDAGTLIIVLILAFVLTIVAFILLAAIIIVLANRLIEIFMYFSISPIPMATMMNNDWGQIGKNWFRNILALSFQGFFIVVALGIFKQLFNNMLSTLVSGNNIVLSMGLLLGFVVAMIFTMFRTSAISKSVFSAH